MQMAVELPKKGRRPFFGSLFICCCFQLVSGLFLHVFLLYIYYLCIFLVFYALLYFTFGILSCIIDGNDCISM